ncbi:MAG: TonB-dependent receptor [Candidatus Eremiobacteraeota bacterium]|nr:TonB-dependent receptor [Candidatus Eremiobacteraeota bacterium]
MKTQRVYSRALCAALLIFVFAEVPHASAAPSPSPSPIPEIAHVVTSDRSDEAPGNAARTTYIISKQQIVDHGYRSVAAALESMPGVTITRYGGTGASASFGIRGSSGAQVLVLLNGIPAGGSQINDLDLNSIPTTGVERIEVVEGGGSTLYGAGSIGGIINIITSPIAGAPIVDLFAGSFGTQGASVETQHLSLSRTLARNDYELPGRPGRIDADSEQTTARTAFDARLGAVSAHFSAGISDHHLGAPGSDAFASQTSRQNYVDRDAHVSLVRKNRHSTATLELGGTQQLATFTCDTPVDNGCPNSPFDPNATPPPAYAQLLSEGRLDAGLRNLVAGERSRTVYGIDLARGVARVDDGGAGPLPVHAFAQTAAYLQQTWLARNGSQFYAGVRAERDGAQGGAVSPSAGAIVRLSRDLLLKANAATAFRAPNADDLYYPGFSNPALRDERARVADLSLDDGSLLGGATLTWFSTSGRDLIVLDSTYTPQNIGRASIQGLTFAIRTLPARGYYASLNLTDLYRAQNLDTGARLAYRGPVVASNLEVGFRGKRNALIDGAAIAVRSAGARAPVDPTQPLFDQAAAHTDIDAYVRVRIDARVLFTLRGYDLGNERYAEFGGSPTGGYPMPGRSFVLEFSTR